MPDPCHDAPDVSMLVLVKVNEVFAHNHGSDGLCGRVRSPAHIIRMSVLALRPTGRILLTWASTDIDRPFACGSATVNLDYVQLDA